MSNASSLFRTLLIYGICVPVAIFLGYMLTDPLNYSTFAGVGFVLMFLSLPILLRWHHAILIASWNFGMLLFFVPGHPELWLAMSWLSLTISVVAYILNRRLKFLSVPSINRPLLLLAVVVVATAKFTGGIGLQALGGETYGGKRYLMILSAIAGYFALTSSQIHPRMAVLCVTLFFLGAVTNAIGELAPMVGPSAYIIFWLFPVSTDVYATLMGDPGGHSGLMARLSGLAAASSGVFFAMLARYGIAQMFTLRKLGYLAAFACVVGLSTLGGFRSMLIMFILTFAAVFYFEGLIKTRLLPLLTLLMLLGGALLVPFVTHLPLSVQRTLSFLPLEVDPIARMSAQDTTEWRVKMWKHVLPEIPQHLILGKGLGFNAADAESAQLADRGFGTDLSAGSELVGDYHNGPLSVILPFGIFGVFAFLWFLTSSVRVLYKNYKFGHPLYRRLNTFLLSYFIAKTIFFFTVFGSLYSDFMTFVGVVGLSVSLNGGVAKPIVVPQPKARLPMFKPKQLAGRRNAAAAF
jgi:hypothetical protein